MATALYGMSIVSNVSYICDQLFTLREVLRSSSWYRSGSGVFLFIVDIAGC